MHLPPWRADPEVISPENWESDFGFMQRPNAVRINLDLFYDYRTNVALYPTWQALLRERQPKTIIFRGQDDIFFAPEGGEAYLKDLPKAEMHRLDAGHFAVEDHLDYISSDIHRFHAERASGGWEFTERERIHHRDAEGTNGAGRRVFGQEKGKQ